VRANINMCGPECSYRSLFEGSQASLSDMASKHAQALSRVGRIRSSVVTLIRKHYPEMAAHAEQNLGKRLSDIDDEILLAYLDAFISNSSSQDHTATLRGLREALTAAGVPLAGDDPLSWVEQVHRYRVAVRESAVRAPMLAASVPVPGSAPTPVPLSDGGELWQGGFDEEPPNWLASEQTSANQTPAYPDPAYLDSEPAVDHEHPDPDAAPGNKPAGPKPVEDYWAWTPKENAGTKTLGELFSATKPPLWDGPLGQMVEETERWTPSPVRPGSEPSPGPGAPAAVPPREQTPSVADSDGRDSTRPGVWPSHRSARPEPPAAPEPSPGLPFGGPAENGNPSPDAPTTPGAPSQPETPVTNPAPAPMSEPRPEPTAVAGSKTTEEPSARERTLIQPPLRPELMPQQTSSKRGKRPIRTQAIPAGNLVLDVPIAAGEPGADLDDQLRQALMAAASIPRPVFSRDLVGVGGSPDAVETWEAECRADPESVPVRFIAPKSRHRLRGPLVIVESPGAVKPSDWWQQCVRKYRAARLYELGVLLHRVGDEVVSFSLGDDAAVFRLDTPRGLVGILVVFDTRLEAGEPTALSLEANLQKLLGERLTLVAVLTTSGERGSLESLTEAARSVLSANGWSPTAPVIAARSWEYADDRGTSSVMVADTATPPAGS
jgi:hypothetical protein